ncbi:1,6-anhydro-N-acetylmuramyl-L-alanine amidase AmpD [Verminephrobacter aporrectodeae subsp. tuberculatae]|uniref:1,6-anhydro-N-acetylmuramyl-L-alanine amidase AmpD n=1 Tax=Verminephrobacter aporrectodeae TaxID=1110389 RepID=UPI002237120E|nr:1,6-anhydro-N-acetylmuramyl-L-alanine amidase AmpD [Verminephrobacter aporrectodeae]MCW5222396.1 1,6-anhydro-N-acetylmuramyl-L-alanine amidase AmpD [Verminephrobacter aporrectodeae subsp. tuberculatae]MCW5287860.1 1,6-anhydro-N-acetylmuramyl-L-alanine amidase AmpD [Verminephrobacter aporrectodeae subsp. tuberculatae]
MTTSDDAPARAAASPWAGGWHGSATRRTSPNQAMRLVPPASVDLIVLHSISLPPGEFGTGAVQQLFMNTLDWDAHPSYQSIRGQRVSAHFFIQRSGALWQFVDCDLRAWHAGRSSYRGRGECNDDSVGIELEGLEGLHFEPAQYRTLVTLCRDIALRYPIEHVAGHEHVAPGRKQDPGAGFDWAQLQHALDWPRRRFPPDACSAVR